MAPIAAPDRDDEFTTQGEEFLDVSPGDEDVDPMDDLGDDDEV